MAASQRALDEQKKREEGSAGAPNDDENFIIDAVEHHTEVLYNYTSYGEYSLAVDYEYNDLYIVADKREPVILNLNTNENKPYLGKIMDARSLTVDQETHDLYIGTTKGIYKYKPSSGEQQIVGATGLDTRHVYFNGVLYYVYHWTNRVSTLINGHDKLVNMQYEVRKLVIDNEVMFFGNTTGLYSRKMDSGHTTLCYKGIVWGLALDRNGTVFFAADDGIYEMINYNASYRKVVAFKYCIAIAFDKNNNMIYSDHNRVYRQNRKQK